MNLKNDEKTLLLSKSINVIYKRLNKTGPISVTVKGKFRPNEEKSNYISETNVLKTTFLKNVNEYLINLDKIQDHFILKIDFTEKGLSIKKWHKFKYTIFFNSKTKIVEVEEIETLIKKIIEDVNLILENCFNTVNFQQLK